MTAFALLEKSASKTRLIDRLMRMSSKSLSRLSPDAAAIRASGRGRDVYFDDLSSKALGSLSRRDIGNLSPGAAKEMAKGRSLSDILGVKNLVKGQKVGFHQTLPQRVLEAVRGDKNVLK